MLKKKNRVGKKDIDLLFKQGKFISSPNLTFKFRLNDNFNIPRISFIVPKNISKLAVNRNLLRRHGYNVLAEYINKFPFGLVGVFIFRKYQASPIGLQPREDNSIIENEIKNILIKIN